MEGRFCTTFPSRVMCVLVLSAAGEQLLREEGLTLTSILFFW